MLTVKHMHSRGATIRQAFEVRESIEGARTVIHADLEGAGTAEYDGGTVYVMNDNGATVAKYDLGGWPEPQNERDVASGGDMAHRDCPDCGAKEGQYHAVTCDRPTANIVGDRVAAAKSEGRI